MKKPRPGGGVLDLVRDDEVGSARATIRGPGKGAFFRNDGARLRDHLEMMLAVPKSVNTRGERKPVGQKKSRTQRARLEVLAT